MRCRPVAAAAVLLLAGCNLLFPFSLATGPTPPALDSDRGPADRPHDLDGTPGDRVSIPLEAGSYPSHLSAAGEDAYSPSLAAFAAGSSHELAVAWVVNGTNSTTSVRTRLISRQGDQPGETDHGAGSSPDLVSDGKDLLLTWQRALIDSCHFSIVERVWNGNWVPPCLFAHPLASLRRPSVVVDGAGVTIAGVGDLHKRCDPQPDNHLFVVRASSISSPCTGSASQNESLTLRAAVLGAGSAGWYPLLAQGPAVGSPIKVTFNKLERSSFTVQAPLLAPLTMAGTETPPSIARHAGGWLVAVAGAGGTTLFSVANDWKVSEDSFFEDETEPSVACCADAAGTVGILATVKTASRTLVLRKVVAGSSIPPLEFEPPYRSPPVSEPSALARAGMQFAVVYTVGAAPSRRVELAAGTLP